MPDLRSERAGSGDVDWPIEPIPERDELPYRVTGIERRTPAIVEAALRAGPGRSRTLLFSARPEADLPGRERSSGWQTRRPQFRFIRTLTRDAGPDPHGRIPDVLTGLCPDLADHDVFVAGAP